MKKLVIVGAGQFGRSVIGLINRNNYDIIGFADNSEKLQGHDLDTPLGSVAVYSMADAVAKKPDVMLISVTDSKRGRQLEEQILGLSYDGTITFLRDLYQMLDVRSATLARIVDRIHHLNIPGAIAELGVYKGDTAWQLNALFPNRNLYLFDTFEGFDPKDIEAEISGDFSRAQEGDFADTSLEYVMNRMAYPDQIDVRKGYFPGTAAGLEEETYALVSLDADLYAPILAGLEYFYPRLSTAGMILLHDFNNTRFRGAKQAVLDYEAAHGPLLLVPLCDLHGTAVIVKC